MIVKGCYLPGKYACSFFLQENVEKIQEICLRNYLQDKIVRLNISYSCMPNCRGGSNHRDELVKFVSIILKMGGSLLGKTLMKFGPNKVKWSVKFV